jgi:hypothetical protein
LPLMQTLATTLLSTSLDCAIFAFGRRASREQKKGAAPQRNSPDPNPLPLEGGCNHMILDERPEHIL